MAVVKTNFLSRALGFQTNITLVLPSFGFADLMNKTEDLYVPGMKFQTMWLLHGFSGDDSDYVNFSNIVRYAESNKLAVVMPPAFNKAYTDEAEGGKYFTFVTEELPLFCRTYFPLSPLREDNFVAGLSMGGAGAMKCAVTRPDMYAAALCMSGACRKADPPGTGKGQRGLPFGGEEGKSYNGVIAPILPGSKDDVYFLAEQNVKEGKPLPRFFISCGDKDFALEGCRSASDFLRGLGYQVDYTEVPGYGHEWDFWDLTLREATKSWLPLRRAALYPEV